ncbi:MAG: cobalamin-dependent protein [Anaerolineaceae bacterium]|nr:cobalamin-dependent protein [Anaerolineaceae bacterium]
MDQKDLHTQLLNLMANLDETALLDLVQKRIKAGDDPLKIIDDCNEGMRLVGQRYEEGRYFISGLIMSGEIFREVVEMVQPLLEQQRTDEHSIGRVLVGTVSGDIHDIGKNILGMLLSCHGFFVIDLGIDVPPMDFAKKAVETRPDIVGLSGLITASFGMMKDTVSLLRAEAETNHISFPIIIGGGMVDDQVCRYVGADHWVSDAMDGVRLCQRLMEKTA